MATPRRVHASGVALRGEGMGGTGTVLMSLPKGGANVECVLD
jgi:hypothetical protein